MDQHQPDQNHTANSGNRRTLTQSEKELAANGALAVATGVGLAVLHVPVVIGTLGAFAALAVDDKLGGKGRRAILRGLKPITAAATKFGDEVRDLGREINQKVKDYQARAGQSQES